MDYVTPYCLTCFEAEKEVEGTIDSCSPSVLFTVLFVLCGLITISSNIINLIALHHTQHCFSENTRLCFQAVAIVDFFVGLFCCTFHSIRFSGLWIASTQTFSVMGVIGCSTLFNQSIMILACVSLDRYLAVTKPLRYHTIVTKRRMLVLILCGMALGTLNSTTSLVHKIIAGIPDLKFASVDIATYPILVIYFTVILASAAITTFCNVTLVTLARKHRRRIVAQSNNTERYHGNKDVENHLNVRNIHNQMNVRGNKDVRTVLAVTGAFYITWGAQVSVNFVSAGTGMEMPCIARNVLLILVISNSFWNAFIYILMNSTFRRTVMRMFIREGLETSNVHHSLTVRVPAN